MSRFCRNVSEQPSRIKNVSENAISVARNAVAWAMCVGCSMSVCMMGVGIMRVGMHKRVVAMRMRMTGVVRHMDLVFVLMMFVVRVFMRVFMYVVGVLVLVSLG